MVQKMSGGRQGWSLKTHEVVSGERQQQRGWVTERMGQLSGCGWCTRGRHKNHLSFLAWVLGSKKVLIPLLPSLSQVYVSWAGWDPTFCFYHSPPHNSEAGNWGTQLKLQEFLQAPIKRKLSGWPKSSYRFSHSSSWKNLNELFGQPNTLKINFCKLTLGTVHYLRLSINLENKIKKLILKEKKFNIKYITINVTNELD